jgi:hypothetical protein
MPWFGGFIGDWFIGCVFFFFSRERERGENFKGRWVPSDFLNFFLNHTKRSNRNAKYVIKKIEEKGP